MEHYPLDRKERISNWLLMIKRIRMLVVIPSIVLFLTLCDHLFLWLIMMIIIFILYLVYYKPTRELGEVEEERQGTI